MIGNYNLKNKKEFRQYVIDKLLNGTIIEMSNDLNIPVNIISILNKLDDEFFINELFKLCELPNH
jgi:hypothetical protein